MSELLTDQENECLLILADAWNKFCALPPLHPVDNHEFMHAIHAAQNIVLARPYLRSVKESEHMANPDSGVEGDEMSGGYWEYSGFKIGDELALVAKDENVKQKWPRVLIPEMNQKIVWTLRIGDSPTTRYAAERIEQLERAITEIRALTESLPSGVDYEADPGDASPADATAFVGGLIWQICERVSPDKPAPLADGDVRYGIGIVESVSEAPDLVIDEDHY
jgi:hypothetical protein